MFRARIGLVAALVMAVLTIVCFTSVQATIGKSTTDLVEGRVQRAQQAVPKLDLLRGIELTADAQRLARTDELGDVFGKTSDDQRRAGYIVVGNIADKLEADGRRADLVVVVAANGHVVARDLNPNAMYNEDLKSRYPSVAKALDGVANKDVWSFDGHLYRVGAAPVRNKAGALVGALVIGYVQSAQDAAADRDKTGAEVAFFLDKKVQASSFKKEGGESAEEKALAAQLFEGANLAAPALAGEMSKVGRVTLRGEEYALAVGPLPGNMTKSASGYVVLSSITAAEAPLASLRWWVLGLGLIGLFAAIGTAVMTSIRFLVPLDNIERGVAEVINGNRDYQFEPASPDLEGLANGLNVMMARLLGRPDPTDDDMGGGEGASNRWQGEISVEESATGPHPTVENMALANEPEGDYLRRVYEEYVAARKQTGEGTEGLTQESFTAKLKQNEASLLKKYNCKMVRFKVVVKNNQVTLKPVPIT